MSAPASSATTSTTTPIFFSSSRMTAAPRSSVRPSLLRQQRELCRPVARRLRARRRRCDRSARSAASFCFAASGSCGVLRQAGPVPFLVRRRDRTEDRHGGAQVDRVGEQPGDRRPARWRCRSSSRCSQAARGSPANAPGLRLNQRLFASRPTPRSSSLMRPASAARLSGAYASGGISECVMSICPASSRSSSAFWSGMISTSHAIEVRQRAAVRSPCGSSAGCRSNTSRWPGT